MSFGGGAWQGSWQHEAGAGWQPASARELEASDAEGGAAAPAAAASFLQAEMHPGLNQPMECDCEKCKCTCLRHCACDSGTVTQAGEAFVHGHDTAAAAAQAHLQMHAGAGAPEEPPHIRPSSRISCRAVMNDGLSSTFTMTDTNRDVALHDLPNTLSWLNSGAFARVTSLAFKCGIINASSTIDTYWFPPSYIMLFFVTGHI